MCILLEIFLKDKLSSRLLTVCCGFITIICLLDQIPAEKFIQEPQNLIKQRFTHDKKFIESIEAFVPKGSAIFQYPYITFPEGGYYEPVIGFIHSKNLHWNFGGMRGRKGDSFYRALDKEPLDKQLEVIKKLGFQGIYIDKRFYKDGGQAMTQVFTQLLGKAPDIKSEDGQIVFFKLNRVKEVKLDNVSLSEVVKNVEGSPPPKNTAKNLFQHYANSK
jgi:phosphoglycerol transferase